jgi:integrase
MKGSLRRRGKESWELKFDAGKDPQTGRRRIEYRSFRGTRKEAEAKLIELVAQIGKGEYVALTKMTLGDYVAARINHWATVGQISSEDGISPTTAERYRHLLRLQIDPHIGSIALQKLKPFDLETWHTKLAASGLSARTIGHAHSILVKALDEAQKNEMVIRNVAKIQAAPTAESTEAIILSPDQVKALPHLLHDHDLLQPVAITALHTGLRRGELLALRWGAVDLERGTLRVVQSLEQLQDGTLRFKVPKTRAGRRDISLPTIVIDTLRDHRRQQLELRLQLGLGKLPDDALVFQNIDGSPRSPKAVSIMWARFAEKIGAPDVTFHNLRHTHASMLIDAGVDVVTISKRLGHSSPTVTLEVYAHRFQQSDSKAAAAINAALGGGKSVS